MGLGKEVVASGGSLDLRKSRTPLVILNSPKPLLALLGYPLLLSHLALPGFQCRLEPAELTATPHILPAELRQA